MSCLNAEPYLSNHSYDAPHPEEIEGVESQQAVPQKEVVRHLQFLDLCAGLGGFHHAFNLVQRVLASRGEAYRKYTFECVMACEIATDLRQLYISNFPEIQNTYKRLYRPNWVAEAGFDLYDENGNLKCVHGDIERLVDLENQKLIYWPDSLSEVAGPIVPKHDILCAGFPCQPFSKSGAQQGFEDVRGTVFGMLAVIIKEHTPPIVLLENVGNFERHDGGNTWARVRSILESLGYRVNATTHVASGNGSQGLLSPHHLGLPHHRERFFIAATHDEKMKQLNLLPNENPFPSHFRSSQNKEEFLVKTEAQAKKKLFFILKKGEQDASSLDLASAKLPASRTDCINIWGEFLQAVDVYDRGQGSEDEKIVPLPSFPIWGYELDPWFWYPIETNPLLIIEDIEALRDAWKRRLDVALPLLRPPEDVSLQSTDPSEDDLRRWVDSWPAYAKRDKWPRWKQRFIDQNRKWSISLISKLDNEWFRFWLDRLKTFSPSLQKLEWNCKGEKLDIHKHILQFRPSGLRVKRFCHVPALVAMTTTQIPIVPVQTNRGRSELDQAKSRYLMPHEALVLQGFPSNWVIPEHRGSAYQAFGNAVHAELVKEVLLNWLFNNDVAVVSEAVRL